MAGMIADKSATDAPGMYRTAQRPGQSGAQDQNIPGPSPLSPNPTGPHPPYEPQDQEGFAAGKHVKPAAIDAPAGEAGTIDLERAGITVIGDGA